MVNVKSLLAHNHSYLNRGHRDLKAPKVYPFLSALRRDVSKKHSGESPLHAWLNRVQEVARREAVKSKHPSQGLPLHVPHSHLRRASHPKAGTHEPKSLRLRPTDLHPLSQYNPIVVEAKPQTEAPLQEGQIQRDRLRSTRTSLNPHRQARVRKSRRGGLRDTHLDPLLQGKVDCVQAQPLIEKALEEGEDRKKEILAVLHSRKQFLKLFVYTLRTKRRLLEHKERKTLKTIILLNKMAFAMQDRGTRSFKPSNDDAVEAEYDRLRDLARAAGHKRSNCLDRSRAAYQSGDGAAAKSLSEEGKAHGREMEKWNKAASDFIFREENANKPADTIDLHGQFAEEAEDIVEEAIKARKRNGETHLHVIVGKGNHSVGGVMKIRPRVEKVCGELGLNWRQEDNSGVLFIDLTGGNAQPEQGGRPQEGHQQQHGGQQHGHHPQQGLGGQQQHRPQQHGGQQQQQTSPQEDIVTFALKKLEKACCIMM